MFRNLDVNHDWTFGNGKNNYLTDNEEIGLNIVTRVLSFFGDCFFAVNEGIDWFNLLDYRYRDRLENEVTEVIKNTSGVTGINEVNILTNSERKIYLTYDIQTVYSSSYRGEIQDITGL